MKRSMVSYVGIVASARAIRLVPRDASSEGRDSPAPQREYAASRARGPRQRECPA